MTDEKLPTDAEQMERYKAHKAEYDKRLRRWEAGGCVGDPPPRPVASSEEAPDSDTERLDWLDKWVVRIGLGDSGVYSFVWVDADGNESELPEADLYEKYENIRKAIDAARVLQGEGHQ